MAREAPLFGSRLLPTLIDETATSDPNRIYAAIPQDDADLSKGFKNITYAAFARVIDRLARWLDNTLGHADGTFPTFAYFGPRDLGYAIVVVAAAKVGRKVLLASHLATMDAHLSLLDALSCTAVIYTPETTKLAQSLQPKYTNARYICTKSLGSWLTDSTHTSSTRNERYEYTKPYSKAHSDPVVVVHTSGTTGMPKPVIWTHAMLAQVDRFHSLPGSSVGQMAGQGIYCALPVFHTSGITASLLTPVYMNTIIILGPAGVCPDKSVVQEVLEYAPVDAATFPPSLLEDLISDPTSLGQLKRLKKIVYGGAPIATWTHRIIASEFNHNTVSSTLGSTEGGLWLTSPAPDPLDHGYFSLHPFMAHGFEQTDTEDLYELVIKRTPHSETYTNFFRYMDAMVSDDTEKTCTTSAEFRTKDLFSPHAIKKGLWRYRCRKDDLVLLSGEVKMYAGAIEEAISTHAGIEAVVVGGQQRSRPFLLVEPTTLVTTQRQKEEFVHLIWPTVEAENEKHFEVARLERGLVIVVGGAGKKIQRTAKGSVDRKATIALFEEEIDEIYDSWSRL
jgi:acyl-coenzyme A synthetase/AMP-(fatty) acid ligase